MNVAGKRAAVLYTAVQYSTELFWCVNSLYRVCCIVNGMNGEMLRHHWRDENVSR